MPTMPQETLNPADRLLEIWSSLGPIERVGRFRELPATRRDHFFLELDARSQALLIQTLLPEERRLWIRLLAPDDAADVIQELPTKRRQPLLELLDDHTRVEVVALLAYQEDAAGGLMSPRFARVRPDSSIDEAISYLRQQASHVETIYYAYALDEDQHLLGVVSFRDLFAAERQKRVRDIMRTDFISVRDDMDQETVAHRLSSEGLLAVPVLDAEGRMKGIVTVDDIVDVVREEASEDIQKIGGMEALDGPYLQIRLSEMFKKRAGWLAILFVGEMLTATAMGQFEDEIAKAVILALFVPLIISSGGNSGSQATTLVIRAMALGEIKLRDWWRVIRRELPIGFALGSMLACIGFARILVWQRVAHTYGSHYMLVALTVSASLIGVVMFGSLAGSMLPFILRRCGLDPASASAPFVATLVDVTGLIIYFEIARFVMRGTLL